MRCSERLRLLRWLLPASAVAELRVASRNRESQHQAKPKQSTMKLIAAFASVFTTLTLVACSKSAATQADSKEPGASAAQGTSTSKPEIDAPAAKVEPPPNPELSEAVKTEDLSKVKELLAKKLHPDARDNDGGSPLLYAAIRNQLEILRTLLDAGARIDIETKQHYTPLCFASHRGHEQIAQLLIERGADIEHKGDDGFTPLIFATKGGHTKIVELLLGKKALVDKRDKDGLAALHYACLKGHADIVRLLLAHGADFNAVQPNAMPPRTPIIMAAWNGNTDVVKLLTEKKAQDDWLTKIEGFSVENVRPLFISRAADGHFTNFSPTGLALGAWMHNPERPWKEPPPAGPDTMFNNIYRWDQPGRGDSLPLLTVEDANHNVTVGEFLIPAYISPEQIVFPDGVVSVGKNGPSATIRVLWGERSKEKSEVADGSVRISIGGRWEAVPPNAKNEFVYIARGIKRWEPVSVEYTPKAGQPYQVEFDCVLRGASEEAVTYSVYRNLK